jgi:uncharacterized damage-inducible protein DinB
MILPTARLLAALFIIASASQSVAALPNDESTSGFVSDFVLQINEVQKQIMSLEDAVPQEKFGWRPAEGVRSVGEVYLHIAFGNYLLLKFQGIDPPANIAPMIDVMKVNEWDSSTSDKAEIAAHLTKSFEHLRARVAHMSDENLAETVDFFGTKMTRRNVLMSALAHLHEHLGQSIAYARMNGVVPPWTAAQQQGSGN